MQKYKHKKSRLKRVEQQRAKRAVFVYTLLTFGLIILIFTYGFGFLSTVTSTVYNYFRDDPPTPSDIIAPAPPRLFISNEYVNQEKIEIEGSAESGSSITVDVNGITFETVADINGEFSLKIKLKEGKNKIFATAKDSAGNLSQNSQVYEIVYDITAPTIKISQPTEGQEFSGAEKQIQIKGSLNEKGSLVVNSQSVYVSTDGKFETKIELKEGENKFEFTASDLAGNQTQTSLTVIYRP